VASRRIKDINRATHRLEFAVHPIVECLRRPFQIDVGGVDERRQLDFDVPAAFDTELACEHVAALHRGEPIETPVYDFTIYDRSEETVTVEAAPIVLIEGIMALTDERLRSLMDLIVYVDVDADVRVLRRLTRDVAERGRSVVSVVSQYLETVRKAHAAFVEPCRAYADLIVPEGGDNILAAEVLAAYLRTRAS
jgi:uridine kinase